MKQETVLLSKAKPAKNSKIDWELYHDLEQGLKDIIAGRVKRVR